MAFVYEIDFFSNSSYMVDMLQEISNDSKIDINTKEEFNKIILEIDDTDSKKLDSFLRDLGSNLPLSIFMGKVEQKNTDKKVIPHTIKTNSVYPVILPSPKQLIKLLIKNTKEYYNPFFNSKNSVNLLSIEHNGYKNRFDSNFIEAFKNIATFINNNLLVRLKGISDYKLFSKDYTKLKNEIMLLAVRPQCLDRLFFLNKRDSIALSSIERPLVKLLIKDENFKKLIGKSLIRVKLPDDVFSFLLAKRAEELGIEYIFYTQASKDTQADVYFSNTYKIDASQKDLEVFSLDEDIYIKSGQRGIFPKLHKKSTLKNVDTSINSIAKEYDDNYLIIKSDSKKESFTQSDDKKAFVSVLIEHQQQNSRADGIYLSSKSQKSSFLVYHPMWRLWNIVDFHLSWSSGVDIFDNIAKIDENRVRLLVNFKSKFPNTYKRLKEHIFSHNNPIRMLFEAICIILDLDDLSFDSINNLSLESRIYSGLKLDIGVFNRRFFNFIPFLTSIMSYKMADVENEHLALSVFDSLASFIVDTHSTVQKSIKCDNLVLCGDICSNKILIGHIKKKIKNANLLLNRQYPIDEENTILGALYIKD